MEPIFTDKEVRDLMNYWKWRATDGVTGEETGVYFLCKKIRDAVEDKIIALGEIGTPSIEHLYEHPWKKEGVDYGHLAVEIDDEGNATGRTGRLKNILTGEVTWDDA